MEDQEGVAAVMTALQHSTPGRESSPKRRRPSAPCGGRSTDTPASAVNMAGIPMAGSAKLDTSREPLASLT
jgi:hypothetical protein